MVFDKELGIIYDVFCFGNLYFGRGEQRKESDEAKVFTELLGKVGELPSYMNPFFIGDPGKLSVLYREEWTVCNGVIDQFLGYLENTELVISNLVDCYFPNEQERVKVSLKRRDISVWYQLCERTELPKEMKMSLFYLANEYDILQWEIRKVFYKIYCAVKEQHTQSLEQKKLPLNMDEGQFKRFLYRQQVDVSDISIENLHFAFSLMSSGCLWDSNKKMVVVGIEAWGDYVKCDKECTIDICRFLGACGVKGKFDIITFLAERGELSIAEITKEIDMSNALVRRYTKELVEQGIFLVSREEANRKYYKLNSKYFFALRSSLDQWVEKLIRND